MARKTIAARPLDGAVAQIANDGLIELDYASAILTGARALIEGREDFQADNELLHLLYLVDCTEERIEKARSIFDEQVSKLRMPSLAAVAERAVSHA